MLYNIVGIVSI